MNENNKPKILLIDDEELLRRTIHQMLTPLDYEIFEAGNPYEAFELLGQHDIELCILDIRMPKMDGITGLKEIKSSYPKTQVIMLSGHANKQHAIKALQHNAFDFLEKPINMALLQKRVQNAMEFISQQKILDEILEVFVDSYCKETTVKDFEAMDFTDKNKILKAGLGILKLEHFKKKEYA